MWGSNANSSLYNNWIWLVGAVYLSEGHRYNFESNGLETADGKSIFCLNVPLSFVLQVVVPSLSLMTCHLLSLREASMTDQSAQLCSPAEQLCIWRTLFPELAISVATLFSCTTSSSVCRVTLNQIVSLFCEFKTVGKYIFSISHHVKSSGFAIDPCNFSQVVVQVYFNQFNVQTEMHPFEA